MSWKVQGYYNDENDLAWKWQVHGNKEDRLEAIDSLHGKDPELGEWKEKVILLYGPSGFECFRGCVLCDNIEAAKKQLQKMEGYAVYRNQYGAEVSKFFIEEMSFFQIENIIIFYQKRNWDKEEWKELVDDLRKYIPKA